MTEPQISDGAVDAAAEAMHGLEYPRWSETAHPDSNRWSWRGDGHGEAHRERYRTQARAALAAAVPLLEAEIRARIADEIDGEARWQRELTMRAVAQPELIDRGYFVDRLQMLAEFARGVQPGGSQ